MFLELLWEFARYVFSTIVVVLMYVIEIQKSLNRPAALWINLRIHFMVLFFNDWWSGVAPAVTSIYMYVACCNQKWNSWRLSGPLSCSIMGFIQSLGTILLFTTFNPYLYHCTYKAAFLRSVPQSKIFVLGLDLSSARSGASLWHPKIEAEYIWSWCFWVNHVPAPIEESPIITNPACVSAQNTQPKKILSLVAGRTRLFSPMRTSHNGTIRSPPKQSQPALNQNSPHTLILQIHTMPWHHRRRHIAGTAQAFPPEQHHKLCLRSKTAREEVCLPRGNKGA